MSGYFICKVCDKSIKIKSKKKHLNSLNHKTLSMSVICKNSVTSPDFLHAEKILKKIMFLITIKNLNFIHLYVNGIYIFRILLLMLNLIPGIAFLLFTI